MMSEAELHQLRRRLHSGAWNKAQRGELRLALPVGLARLRSGEVVLHPDEEVQARIRLVFEKFEELKTAKAVVRYLRQADLRMPSRPLQGPAPHEVVWRTARYSRVLAVLKNPAYTGTYVYGRTTMDPTKRKPGHPNSGIVCRSIDDWPIVLHNVYPAYIHWEIFLANQAQLEANQNNYREDKVGAPKRGQALLQGILRCGLCGARMRLHYSGPQGNFPVYKCNYAYNQNVGPNCQEVRSLGLDGEIERLILEALKPDQLELALAALKELEEEYATLKRQRELHLERLKYEAERARRQYDSVEPENRLVARTLEGSWEEKLRTLDKAEQEYQSWAAKQQLELTPADRETILSLGTNLPQVWHAATTTPADCKQIIRLVIKEVIVDQKRARGKVLFQINWQTSAISQHEYIRRVNAYDEHADIDRIEQRIRELHAKGKFDVEIAATLNAEGFRTTKQTPFHNKAIWRLRKRMGLPAVKTHGLLPEQWEDGCYSVVAAAKLIGVIPGTIFK